jgi:hypothetical protein
MHKVAGKSALNKIYKPESFMASKAKKIPSLEKEGSI